AVGQDRALAFDGADHAVAVGTIPPCDVFAVLARRRVHVVPGRGRLEAVRIEVAQAVGPGGDAGQRRLGLAGEQALDLRVHRGIQVALGEFADQLVAEHAP